VALYLVTEVSLMPASKQVLHWKHAIDLTRRNWPEWRKILLLASSTHLSSLETPGVSQDQWRSWFTLLNSTLGETSTVNTVAGWSIRSRLMINARVFLRKIYNCTIPPPFLPPLPPIPFLPFIPLTLPSPFSGVSGVSPPGKFLELEMLEAEL